MHIIIIMLREKYFTDLLISAETTVFNIVQITLDRGKKKHLHLGECIFEERVVAAFLTTFYFYLSVF